LHHAHTTGLAGQPAADERANAHAGDGRHEKPTELGFVQTQVSHHVIRRRRDVQEQAAEQKGAGQRQTSESGMQDHFTVGRTQRHRMERDPLGGWVRFRQE